ncbi:MAG: PD40 domain-containing protein [Gemmatimonadales bacterium]|nr:PD40 domain-containing protein [Gemmatimonadales bacterium]
MLLRSALTATATALVAFLAATPLAAQSDASWMRYPALSPDGQSIAFTYKGDLYRVAASGGVATQLTQHAAQDMMPVWSPDGTQLVFASDRNGNFDLFVMPAVGGEARRLTFHSADEFPYSFAARGAQVVFGAARMDAAENRLYPTGSQPELYQVPVAGGRPIQLLTTPAEDARFSADGSFLIYHDKKGGENSWRKHHTSAIARDIWVMDVRSGVHRKVTTFAGEDRTPILVDSDRAMVYLSEESGTFNVHRRNLDGTQARQLTEFRGIPVRFLSAANDGTIGFGHDGQLYTMRSGERPVRVAVTIRADHKENDRQVVAVNGGARELAVSPNGKEVAFIFRGDVFVASVEGGITKQLTNTPAVEVGVEFSPDGNAIAYASERDAKWGIYEVRRTRDAEPYFYASTVVRESPLVVNTRQNYQPKYSPDGKELAYIEDRNTLRVRTIQGGATRTLLDDRSLWSNNPNHQFSWSPDGKWILFDLSVPGIAPGEVGLIAADGRGSVINLTESGFNDGRAKWILGGQAMLWFSDRDGLKSVAQSGAAQQDVYGLFLTRESWDRYRLTKEELALVTEAEAKATKAKADSAKGKADSAARPAAVTLDLTDLGARKARLTIHSSTLGDALVSKDGENLYYLARFERGMNLWTTNLRTRETKQLVALDAQGGTMVWDKEQKSIFLLTGGSIARIDPSSGKRDAVPLRGEMTVDLAAEREEMFDHVWRKTRDTYYTAGYHGVDWQAIRPVYAKYLPHIGNEYEFAEMLAEMLGELNVSHSGARYTSTAPMADATAALGVILDQTFTAAGARITEVLENGPLAKAGMNVTPGTIIESVDGVAITPAMDIAEQLNRKDGKNVLLGLAANGARRELVVKPITQAEEGRLLYARFVKRNREEVARLSDGQLGYVHIPGMNDGAYRTTFEEVMGKDALKKGIVVDTRFNGGGDLVADLAMFLSGKRFFDYTTDTRSSGYEPNFRWSKPSVSLANEANYSDGHCYAYAYKDLQIGPLVGMPVPGTCTFAGWETLQGGIRWGVPGLGVKDANTGRYLENLQTEPDILVMNEYDKVSKGQDQQLVAAVNALLRLVR